MAALIFGFPPEVKRLERRFLDRPAFRVVPHTRIAEQMSEIGGLTLLGPGP
jgi:hypothetical protein